VNTQQVIQLLRRKILTVDTSVAFEDADLLAEIEDARAFLEAKAVAGMAGYVIDPTDTTDGIAPDMTSQHALIATYQAAIFLLQQRYADLTQAGALGVVWRSGLEEESTVTAEKAYRTAIGAIQLDLDKLILVQNKATFAIRQT
jgi:hypothetical protein